MERTFSRWKNQCLNKLDLSKKGSVDEGIKHVVSLLNSCAEYFTTSSCAGRIILIDGASVKNDVQKQNCIWLFVSHQKCESVDLISGLTRSSGDAVLKFEPLVLHVQCRQLDDAQLMHSVAVSSGFRNSGLTISKTGKIITAVRSTHGLEVPLSRAGKLLVEHEYIRFLAQVANQKMEENLRRIDKSVRPQGLSALTSNTKRQLQFYPLISRFYHSLQSALLTGKLQKLQLPHSREPQASPHRLETEGAREPEETLQEKRTSVYKRRRRREQQHQTDCCHGDGPSDVPELDGCLDLFT